MKYTRPGSICRYFASKRSRIAIVPASPIAAKVVSCAIRPCHSIDVRMIVCFAASGPSPRARCALTLSLWAIRHDDGLGAIDEDKGSVADDGHTSGGREPVLHHTHVRAIAIDRQFSKASLALGLDQRPWTHSSQSVGSPQRHRRFNLHDRAGAAVSVHGNAEDLAAEERVHVNRAVGKDRHTIDGG